MSEHNDNLISRKDFLRKAWVGLLSFTFFKGISFRSSSAQTAHQQTPPKYRVLGRTGVKVTPVGYGASRTMEPTLVKSALDTGINFIDTGRSYYNGQNEVMVGKVIQGIRKEVIIQSKIRLRLRGNSETDKSIGTSKRIHNMMRSSLEESLKALQTDYIDIMLLHGADSVDIIKHETVMEFFRIAKKKGQIRACGFSSHNNQVELVKAANESKFYDVMMVPYNHRGSYTHSRSGKYSVWDQPALEIELKKAEKNNIGIVAMKTCSGGPYAPDAAQKPSYKAALQWVLNHSYISTMAVAMGNTNELNQNVQAMS
jgi:aryl-alcohol dehydrogenase-like predicted oxidoreductase